MTIDWGTRRQGDVLALTTSLTFPGCDSPVSQVLIVSQTCDVVQSKREFVILAPIESCAKLDFDDAKKGRRSSLIAVDGSEGSEKVARLDLICAHPKCSIEGEVLCRLSGNSESSEEARGLAHNIGNYFSRFPIPDAARNSFEGLVKRLRSDSRKPVRERVLNDVLQVRVAARPGWLANDCCIRIFLLIEAGSFPQQDWSDADLGRGVAPLELEKYENLSIADVYSRLASEKKAPIRSRLWERFGDCLQELTHPEGPVSSIEVEVVSEDCFTYSDWRRSESLNLEALSPMSNTIGLS